MNITVGDRQVSALLTPAQKPLAIMALAHGAGAGMTHSFMGNLAEALKRAGVSTLRFQFPYMEDGRKRPDRPPLAIQTVAAAARAAHEIAGGLPVFLGGKSFGGRMATTALADGLAPDARGVVLFGFPLHPSGEPATKRGDHLARVAVPMLFLQGTRDDLAELPLMRDVTNKLPLARLHVVEGADHGFDVLKKSGRSADDVLTELASAVRAFIREP